jgi:DNA-binding transcriptional regulator YiaG
MTTTTDREQLAKRQAKTKGKSTSRAKKPRGRTVKAVIRPTTLTAVAKLRARLALTQAEFARLLAVSVRSLATLEGGTAPSEAVARRLTELERLTGALSEVIKRESLEKWLRTPNPAFGGSKPLEVIERGESDRLWEMVYFLRSGVPF